MANFRSIQGQIGMRNVVGIDPTNVVHTFTKDSGDTSTTTDTSTWTATEDCIIAGTLVHDANTGNASAKIYVNNVDVLRSYCRLTGGSSPTYASLLFASVYLPVKKGQEIKVFSAYNYSSYVKAYRPLY